MKESWRHPAIVRMIQDYPWSTAYLLALSWAAMIVEAVTGG